jgi:hypothetical protein
MQEGLIQVAPLARLLKEIFAHYQALLQKPTLSLAPAPYGYRAFVAGEQQARQSGEAKAFWRLHLRHHQPFTPPPGDYNAYQPAVRQLPADLLPKLAAVQKSLRVTMKALFAAAFLRVVQVEFLEVGGLDKFHTPLHMLVGKNPFNKNISLVLNYDTRYYSESQIEDKLEDYLLRLELLCHLIPEPHVFASN